MKAKKNAPKTKKTIIRVDSMKSDDKQEAIIPREKKDLESQENPDFNESLAENEENSDDDYAAESETIARVLSHKIVNYIRNPNEQDMQDEGENKDDSNQDNLNESGENGENIKNDDLELRTVNRSIADVMKDDHFYQEENSRDIKSDKKKRFYKKKSILEISLVTGFNSIKYRLKKNYFGSAQR